MNAGAQRGILARGDLEAGLCRERQVHGGPSCSSGFALTPPACVATECRRSRNVVDVAMPDFVRLKFQVYLDRLL